MRPLVHAGLSVLILLFFARAVAAQDAQAFYDDTCAMCHSIGGEPGAGPDLKGVTERRDRQWLVRFIRDPNAAARQDAAAAALVKQFDNLMPPTEGASRELLESLVDLIAARSAMAGGAAPRSEQAAASRDVTEADIALGRALFDGHRAFANGGPGCVSCHQLTTTVGRAGGALGPPLATVHQRLGGTGAISAWMRNPPTPVMRALYRRAPLTADETHAVAAVLAGAGREPPPSPPVVAVLLSSVAGLLAMLALMGIAWRGRFRGVRHAIVEQARAARIAGGRS